MAVPHYDPIPPRPISGVSCMVRVERVYRFAWDRFDGDDRAVLAASYRTLPGFQDGPAGVEPCWFGDDEDVPPFLTAREAPPGLRVFGILPEADWHAWDARFRAATAALPAREVG